MKCLYVKRLSVANCELSTSVPTCSYTIKTMDCKQMTNIACVWSKVTTKAFWYVPEYV